jgi:hypothetical protein
MSTLRFSENKIVERQGTVMGFTVITVTAVSGILAGGKAAKAYEGDISRKFDVGAEKISKEWDTGTEKVSNTINEKKEDLFVKNPLRMDTLCLKKFQELIFCNKKAGFFEKSINGLVISL